MLHLLQNFLTKLYEAKENCHKVKLEVVFP